MGIQQHLLKNIHKLNFVYTVRNCLHFAFSIRITIHILVRKQWRRAFVAVGAGISVGVDFDFGFGPLSMVFLMKRAH